MSYYTGSAADMTAVRQALIDACISEGWTWDSGNQVLYKDTIYVALKIASGNLNIQGRTSLTAGAAPYPARMGTGGGSTLSFPLTYHVFVFAQEVYAVVNYNVSEFQWLAFGLSTVAGLAGTGIWFGASMVSTSLTSVSSICIGTASGGFIGSGYQCPALFWRVDGTRFTPNCMVHHGFTENAAPWYLRSPRGGGYSAGVDLLSPLIGLLPNAWNSEAALLPLRAYTDRTSTKVSLVADLEHARITRVDFYEPGDVITIGSDRWKTFPWLKKDSSNRNGGSGVTHTGTLGWAIRYEGD